MKTKKALPAWRKAGLEIFRYFFFAGYLVLMAGILYSASFFYSPSAAVSAAGGKP